MSDNPRVNHTNRVFEDAPNDTQALSAQPAAVNVEEMAPGGERAPPRYRDIRKDLTNESPRVRRTSSSWKGRERDLEGRSKTCEGSMDVRAAVRAGAAATGRRSVPLHHGERSPNLNGASVRASNLRT